MLFQPRKSVSESLDLLRKRSKAAQINVRSLEKRELSGGATLEDDPPSSTTESTPQVEEIKLDPDLLPDYEEALYYY